MASFTVSAPCIDYDDIDDCKEKDEEWDAWRTATESLGFVFHEPPDYENDMEYYEVTVPDCFASKFSELLADHPWLRMVRC